MKNKLSNIFKISLMATVLSTSAHAKLNKQSKQPSAVLQEKKWLHGASDCQASNEPLIEVFQYDSASYVLRQSKCTSYEAPFIYLLFGKEKVLVLDTGATENPEDFPLYETVKSLINKHKSGKDQQNKEILVIHSHGHRDHFAGDRQFQGLANVTLIDTNKKAIEEYFQFIQWPENPAILDLGERKLTVIPTPGHQEEALSIYDEKTQWLLTGDTFYPGAIFVKNWLEYKNSIARLASFSDSHNISLILGAHIEMTNNAGEYYSIGTTYQPDEASLALLPKDLSDLHSALDNTIEPKKIAMNKFIVEPMGAIQKTISNIVRWITQ